MPLYDWMQPQEVADMVCLLKIYCSKEMTNKEVFADACQRCHSIKYADIQKNNGSIYSKRWILKIYG